MVREKDVLNLIGNIYDATLDESRWPSVLHDLVKLTHTNVGSLAELDLTNGSTTPIAAVDMPSKEFSDYETNYWQADAANNEHRTHATETGISENSTAAGSHVAAALAN